MMATLFLLLNLIAQDDRLTGIEQMLTKDQEVQAKESFVTIDGVPHYSIEYEQKKYFFRFNQRTGSYDSLTCFSLGNNSVTSPNSSVNLIEGSLKIRRKKRIFLSMIQESCEWKNGRPSTTVKLNPKIGSYLPGFPLKTMKNTRIYVTPKKGLQLDMDW